MGDGFKSGSGNLNFGTGSESESDETEKAVSEQDETSAEAQSSETASTTRAPTADDGDIQNDARDTDGDESQEQYPYFIRRSNVGDERSQRIELHIRPELAEQEAGLLNDLADRLNTDSVAKTDAREYLLKAAIESPEVRETIAKMMEEDGYEYVR